MEPVAYKPISGYDENLNTQISKDSFVPGLLKFGVLRGAVGTRGAGTTIVYTCPANLTFFLISCSLSWRSLAYVPGAYLNVNVNKINSLIYVNMPYKTSPDSGSITNSFPIPLKLNSTETIEITGNSGDFSGSVTIIGYEIPTSLIPSFL